jgi:hypothetical protein
MRLFGKSPPHDVMSAVKTAVAKELHRHPAILSGVQFSDLSEQEIRDLLEWGDHVSLNFGSNDVIPDTPVPYSVESVHREPNGPIYIPFLPLVDLGAQQGG